ncbi:MAG: DUF4395 family protein [Candidatus Omnitrophica bacterium]|nr:DUF4395 family protein [Candidatus Omnitrophota bacterium]
MKAEKQVSINKLAFTGYKATIAVFLWFSFFLKIKWLIAFNFCFLLASALLKIKNAPLVLLYTPLARKISPALETVDEAGIGFAQVFGASIHLIALILLYLGMVKAGWTVVFFLAVLKSISVFGFCSGLKLYQWLKKG